MGGHCIAVDPWFIVSSAPREARLIRTAREVNDSKPHHVVAKVRAAVKKKGKPVVACLGLAFKPDIDDLRESPAVEVTALLAQDKKLRLLAVEPHVTALPPVLAGRKNVALVPLKEALRRASVVVLLVNHREFYAVPQKALSGKAVIDTRGVWR